MSDKSHWENIYKTKQAHEVSWTQEIPLVSLEFIRSFDIPKSAAIIDIGGGDSNLVDFLLSEGHTDVTVLDISEAAIEKAKARLGNKAYMVTWIHTDITDFKPTKKYEIWHDRATFHFLTNDGQIQSYLDTARQAVEHYMVIGTFSKDGPEKCSGLIINQYSQEELTNLFQHDFEKIKCLNRDHITPFNTYQNFTYCSFIKSKNKL